MPLAEWRTFHLPEAVARAWAEPDDLARVVEQALDVGAHDDVVPAAEQLSRIDPDRDRRYALAAVVFARCGQFRRADELLDRHESLYGESAFALAARAEVALSGNRKARGHDLLERAIRLDPGGSRPLRRLIDDFVIRGGKVAAEPVVRRVFSTSGSWRAGMWLASAVAKDAGEAAALVREALGRAGDEPLALAVASSVLAQHDAAAALEELVAPRFRPELDDPECGVNVLFGLLAAGAKGRGRTLLATLSARLEAAGMAEYASFYRTAFESLDADTPREGRGEPDTELLRAMAAAARQSSRKARAACWRLLASRTLLVPVRQAWIDIPIFESPWPRPPRILEVLAGVDSEGREVAIAFTDRRTMRAWGPTRSPCVTMATRALLEIVAREKGCTLLVNPAGPTATELALPDIEAFLDGRQPAGEESTVRFLAEPLRREIPRGFLEALSSFLRVSGIVREAWLFEMVDDRSGVNPAVAVEFQPDADSADVRELLLDGPDEVRWDSRRSRRVRFIPLEEGRLADVLRAIAVRVTVGGVLSA